MAMIASQLQALRSLVQVEPEQTKRPFIRPSIIYDPKQAADIDRDSLFNIALSGLDTLVGKDKLFRQYKGDLFSQTSRELDRELLGVDDNDRINASVSSYLRLLSGYLHLPSSLKTLEYLIRRYKIHVYNMEELILCALPYHDTHAFVRIVQIINTGNSKWKFLDGVKTSGASPPRKVIVQQCIRDMGILEVLCNYASPSKKSFPSKPVINFCTAVVFETLGSVTLVDNDVVTRILPFVFGGLRFGAKGGPDHKAGALMIIVLLADRATLLPKVLQSLMRLIISIALEDMRESTDLQWVRMPFIALVNLVQLQSVDIIHQKALIMLEKIRDLPGILNGLTKEFNIERFLGILLDSLIYHCSYDDWCHHMLVSIIETFPVKSFIHRIVCKVLSRMKLLLKASPSTSSKNGTWAKHILAVINKNHPPEFLKAVHKFMESTRELSTEEGSSFEVLCRILDMSPEISDSKIWLALEHPKAEVRRVTLTNIDAYENLQDRFTDSQGLVTIQDAILRRLGDDDLAVVQIALSLKCLSKIFTHQHLLEASKNVLQRCIQILNSGVPQNASLAGDVAISSLELAIKILKDQTYCRKELATMMFPLLLILPRSQRLNLIALNLSKEVGWPIYENLNCSIQKLEKGCIPSINMDTVDSLAASLSMHFEEYMPWIIECCGQAELSKTIFFLVLMQSFVLQKSDSVQFYKLLEVSFPFLKSTWEMFETSGIVSAEGFNEKMLDWDCRAFLEHLLDTNFHEPNPNILACVFWKLLENLSSNEPSDFPLDYDGKWLRTLENLFVLFAASQSNHIFKKHLQYLVTMCMTSPVPFLSNMFTGEGFSVAVQVESLQCFGHLCSQPGVVLPFQLLSEFPSVLVPLCSDNQDLRIASMKCIEELSILLPHIDASANKASSSSPIWRNFLGELLGLVVQQKKLLLLDRNFLSSFFTSLLGNSSFHSLLFPESIGKRFDQSTKMDVLRFILESVMRLSAKAKLKILSLVKGVGSMILLVKDVESLLGELLRKREHHYFELNNSSEKLSMEEVQILCLLLECCDLPSLGGLIFEEYMLKALQVDVPTTEDPAIIQPCVAVLQILSNPLYSGLKADMQVIFFRELVLLFRNAKGDIHNASREALLRINITCCTVSKIIVSVLEDKASLIDLKYGSKKKKPVNSNWHGDMFFRGNALSFTSSLLDVLLMKKDIENRVLLIKPLFMLLRNFLGDEWIGWVTDHSQNCVQASSGISQTVSSPICFIQQTLLLILQDIITSTKRGNPLKDDALIYLDVELLVQCAHSANDAVTRNHVFSLLSTISRVCADKVLDHIVNILALIGESVVMQFDCCSQSVIEELISALVPCWLSKTDTIDNLLQTFINVLPDVAAHTRLSIMVYLIRTLGEQNSLGSVLALLFRSLVSRKLPSCSQDNLCDPELITSIVKKEWEYTFALDICEQYSCMIWLTSLVSLLQKIGNSEKCLEVFMELLFVMHFVLHKLQDPQFTFQLESMEDADNLQKILGDFVEQVVCHVCVTKLKRKTSGIPSSIRKNLNGCLDAVLRTITNAMRPSVYYRAIIKLLSHEDREVRKKALGLICETVRDKTVTNLLHLDEDSLESFKNICGQISKLIDEDIDSSNAPLKVAAVTALEVLASKFSGSYSVFSMCFVSVSKSITSRNLAISSCCLRTAGALINVFGPRSLPELPHIMEVVLKASHKISSTKFTKQKTLSISKESYMLSILYTLEAIVDKFGGFLNPYLRDIIKLLVLRPDYVSASDSMLKLKCDIVRRLVAEKIPVRLLVPALLDTYSDVVNSGDSSLSAAFEILANSVSTMDKASVSAYHERIYDLCLQALDLRRLLPISIKNINVVETRVINAMIVLTMKLTETMFKPLFIRSIEWAELNADEGESTGSMNLERALSFYGLVNKLAENHRSLFVPYFKYLLEDCIKHLMSSEDTKTSSLTRKKKKAKLQEPKSYLNDGKPLSLGKWHLRALVLSSLHKCFIFDAGSLKFLGSANFQVLLKPIVLQLAAEPPISLEEHLDIPSIEDVDDLLVSCIGQMAITAGNDLLWKSLNHEVLMQTRSEAMRARILGLRVVKHLVENLKEEYMVFLAETIPFLGELLEDVEPPVKSLAQEILREMEAVSGENLRQYL